MANEKDFQNMKRAVCLLLDHAVYDVARNDECANAVEFAMEQLRKFPSAETIAAMQERS